MEFFGNHLPCASPRRTSDDKDTLIAKGRAQQLIDQARIELRESVKPHSKTPFSFCASPRKSVLSSLGKQPKPKHTMGVRAGNGQFDSDSNITSSDNVQPEKPVQFLMFKTVKAHVEEVKRQEKVKHQEKFTRVCHQINNIKLG
jgi:hypothetical protein